MNEENTMKIKYVATNANDEIISSYDVDTETADVECLGEVLSVMKADLTSPAEPGETYELTIDDQISDVKTSIPEIIAGYDKAGELMIYLHDEYGFQDDLFPELYVYERYHTEVSSTKAYIDDDVITSAALNSPNGVQEIITLDHELQDDEIVDIYHHEHDGIKYTTCDVLNPVNFD